MIISDKNHESNRRNAQHSTGPTTPEGKKAASLNAVTYGLRTRSLIIHGENIADYWRLWDGLETEWQPETPTERLYLEGMSVSQWQLARMARSHWDTDIPSGSWPGWPEASNGSTRPTCRCRHSSICWTASPGTARAWSVPSPLPCTN